MRAVVVERPGDASVLTMREVPAPALRPRDVRIAVAACGVCFHDVVVRNGTFHMGVAIPVIPGHEVAGIVTHRQQPDTAKGVVFVNLEDETGLLNVICTADVWRRFRKVARMSPALVVRGMLERYQGVINVVASRIEELPLTAADMVRSRDFH